MKPTVAFVPLQSSELEEAFGWNEDFQLDRFQSRYEPSWFHGIIVDGSRVGYICYWQKPSEIHVLLLIIDSNTRNFGHVERLFLFVIPHLLEAFELRTNCPAHP